MQNKYIARWLFLCCFMVFLIIIVGGFTRLTDSGLSITQWKPITGIIPPFSSSQWQEAFEKYQESPEYKEYNYDMSISDFKFIFLVEFIHRFIARLIALIYLIPLIYCYFRYHIEQNDKKIYLLILSLFGLEGFIGWYMVKSGLVNIPHVSHFRLALHLMLAVLIYTLLFWQLMKNSFDILLIDRKKNLRSLQRLCFFTVILLFGQVFVGALVAGLDAGKVYNTFPLMGHSMVPPEVNLLNCTVHDLYDPIFLQFIHRCYAYILSFIIIILVISCINVGNKKLSKIAYFLMFAIILQFALGIITILYNVPLVVALLHQACSIFLLSCILWCYFVLTRSYL